MNRVSPAKLLYSKWTAVTPVNREKHFQVTKVDFNKTGDVVHCEIEAVISGRAETIDWHDLNNEEKWLQGWK